MSGFSAVDPETPAENAPYPRAFSDQVRGIVTRSQGGLDSLGECWGTESMAKGFAATEATNVASAQNLTRGSTGSPSGTAPEPSTGAHGRPRA